MTAHDIAIYKPCAVIEGVNEFADVSCIAPPGQEGCREATGWWFKEIFW